MGLTKTEERQHAAEYLAQGVTQNVAAIGAGVSLSSVHLWCKDPAFMKLVSEGKARISSELAPRYASVLMHAADVVDKHLTSEANETSAAYDRRVADAMKLVDAGLTPAWLAKLKLEADARSA